LKHPSPAAILVLAAAFVLVLDAAIFVVPQAVAEADRSATPSQVPAASSMPPVIAVASPNASQQTAPLWAGNSVPVTPPIPTPTPTPVPTPTPKPTPVPTMKDTVWNARTYVQNRVGAKGYDCINAVWTAESKWNPTSGNPNGAYGIPQAYPGSKMAAFGSNWRYSPLTQVKWGLWYVNSRYGSACAAYNFWKAHGWY
jgi:hypothetical protein